jgi:hypothetical protein
MRDGISDIVVDSVRKVAFALDKFEPFPRTVIPESTLYRLLDSGLVEAGRSCRPAVGSEGYRLTDKGWQVASAHWTDRRPQF